MKVTGLDGREYNWPGAGYKPYDNEIRERSEPHLRCRALLREVYPLATILEEVPLPGSDRLRVDFLLIAYKKVIEVHGEQHYTFNPFFHGTKMKFLEAKARDKKKIEWCRVNNIEVLELPHYESDLQWRERLAESGRVSG